MRHVIWSSATLFSAFHFVGGSVFPDCSGTQVCSEREEAIVTGNANGVPTSEIYVPTTYTQLASLTDTVTTTLLDPSGSPFTVIAGPSGVAWVPLSSISGVSDLPPPTVPPQVPSQETLASIPPGGTVVVGTIGSSVITETFVPTTLQNFATLASTITSISTDAQGNSYTVLIGPGGIEWTPLNQPSGSLQLPPPTALPVVPTPTDAATLPSGGQASVTDIFANTALSATTLTIGSATETWVRNTFSDLATITGIQTITTPIVETNPDGSSFTVSAAVIVVGPGGVWWNGGTGGLGYSGPDCVWPFCPPNGGGDQGGGGSGHNPKDPNDPDSDEDPEPPDGDNEGGPKPSHGGGDPDPSGSGSESMSSMSSTTTSSTSSCSATQTVSDCSNICSASTSGTVTLSPTCTTTCFSTITGCSVTGYTTTTTISASVCSLSVPEWSDLPTGTDFAYPTTTGTDAQSTASWTYSCMADGAPWYAPTSWCDCGLSLTYPTLPPTSGATTANCDYTTFASSTLVPSTTTAPPTNIPGENGVPGCAAVVSARGTAAYCNCGGTPAPTLEPISSGFINCGYTIQPTSSYSPSVLLASTSSSSSTGSPSAAPTVAWGKCQLQVRDLVHQIKNGVGAFWLNITDANGRDIGSRIDAWSADQSWTVTSELPWVLELNTNQVCGIDGDFPPQAVQFAYGGQSWASTDSQCKSTPWDYVPYTPDCEYNITCSFDCEPKSSSKRSDSGSDGGNTERSSLWQGYAPKGQDVYDKWKAYDGDDATYNCDYSTVFKVAKLEDIPIVEPDDQVSKPLRNAGYAAGNDYLKHDAEAKSGPGQFRNTISPAEGVFLALDNDRGFPEDDDDVPIYSEKPNVPWQFSTVAWIQWKLSVQIVAKAKDQNVDYATLDYSNMKSFWRTAVTNADSKALFAEAFGDDDTEDVKVFTPADRDLTSNPFWALLGSPNGRGIQYFLLDNKNAMNKKGIASLSVVQDSTGYWYMWATLTG